MMVQVAGHTAVQEGVAAVTAVAAAAAGQILLEYEGKGSGGSSDGGDELEAGQAASAPTHFWVFTGVYVTDLPGASEHATVLPLPHSSAPMVHAGNFLWP